MKKIGIDVGACVGETLHQFIDEGFDKIYAIEPGQDEYQQLCEMIIREDWSEKVIPIFGAVHLEDKPVELIPYWNGRFSSLLEFNKEGEFYQYCEENLSINGERERVMVPGWRLDTLINKWNLKDVEIDYVKIDTQGTDLNVVKSLGTSISNVKKISVEVQLEELYKGSPTKEEVNSYMSKNNFTCIEEETHRQRLDEPMREQDLVFINNKFL
tara:strand:- start:477 stop:1115 length:639 start_codon:yes stop_codon:yes gene_type:complete